MIDVKELERNSLDKAFAAQIELIFKTLVASLMEANAPGAITTANQAVGTFRRALQAAQDAYAVAGKLIG